VSVMSVVLCDFMVSRRRSAAAHTSHCFNVMSERRELQLTPRTVLMFCLNDRRELQLTPRTVLMFCLNDRRELQLTPRTVLMFCLKGGSYSSHLALF
jgi:hypothetical protein